MSKYIIKYRLGIVLVALGITIVAALGFPKLKVNANVDDYVPDTVKNKIYLKQLDSIFGGSELILVMLQARDVTSPKTLDRVEVLANALRQVDGIDRALSPFDAQEIGVEDDLMTMAPFFETIYEQETDPSQYKKLIQANRMAASFFSEDFDLVSIVLAKNSKTADTVIDTIKEVIADHSGDEEVLIGGLPFIRYSIASNIQKDLVLLIPVALFLMIGMLYFSFREWRGVFLPFVIVVMSIILAFGLMAYMGWEISLFSILMPIMIIAIANDYGIHLIARYQELSLETATPSMKGIAQQIYTDLKNPIVITGITTIGGILGLLTHKMIPAAQLGILTAIGLGFALVLSLWFLPALLSYFKLKKAVVKNNSDRKLPLDVTLDRLGNWVANYPKKIIAISAILTVIGVLGIFFIKVDTNVESYFSKKSEVGKSTAVINEKFGGSQFISLLFSGEVLSPAVLNRMEEYENTLAKDPNVGGISSPVTLIKELSKGFYNQDESGYNAIPDSIDEIYQLMEVFALGENEEAISQFLDYDYEHARMLVGIKSGGNAARKQLQETVSKLTHDDNNFQFMAGAGLTEIELADIVVKGQTQSLIFAMIVIFIILSLVFRSPSAGVLSGLPLVVAIVLLFGIMGLLGIAIDIATALLSSIMIGVGVDYTIHLLWRFKTELAVSGNHKEAMKLALRTSGRGIVINAISVIVGFLPLTLSGFTPLKFFGALIVLSIGTCLLCALFLVPAIILKTRPKFLEN